MAVNIQKCFLKKENRREKGKRRKKTLASHAGEIDTHSSQMALPNSGNFSVEGVEFAIVARDGTMRQLRGPTSAR